MSHHFDFLDDSAAREQERQILASTPAEFAPIPRAPEIDDGKDLYEGRHRAWEDEQERRFTVFGMDSGERRDTYGGRYE